MVNVKNDKKIPFEVEKGLFAVKLIDGSTGAHGISMVRAWLKPRARHSLHTHDSEEAVYFLSGCGVITINGEKHEIKAGDAVLIPPLVPHDTVNKSSNEDLHLLATFLDSMITWHPSGSLKQSNLNPIKVRTAFLNKLRWFYRKVFYFLIHLFKT